MATIFIIRNSDFKAFASYDAASPDPSRFGGPWQNPNRFTHLVMDASWDADLVKGADSGGTPVLARNNNLGVRRIRHERNEKLKLTDYTQLSNAVPAVMTSSLQSDWETYRGELRGMMSGIDPWNFTWPTPPVTPAIAGVNS